jgi:hypothetical protein
MVYFISDRIQKGTKITRLIPFPGEISVEKISY